VLLEAVAAIYRPALSWLERHLTWLSAVAADRVVHFARAAEAAPAKAASASAASAAPSAFVSFVSKSHFFSPNFFSRGAKLFLTAY
jgi:hypothetical protein